VIGPIQLAVSAGESAHRSPGMHQRHYSPATPLILVEGGKLPAGGRGAYLWIRQEADAALSIHMPEDPNAYAAKLYAALHDADAQRFDWIAVEQPPQDPGWAAILDRLERAAAR
jgi:L-threonylcarbamoyladenylate synthase